VPRTVRPPTGKREHVGAVVIFTKQFDRFSRWRFTTWFNEAFRTASGSGRAPKHRPCIERAERESGGPGKGLIQPIGDLSDASSLRVGQLIAEALAKLLTGHVSAMDVGGGRGPREIRVTTPCNCLCQACD
jgi:hypothetical protein